VGGGAREREGVCCFVIPRGGFDFLAGSFFHVCRLFVFDFPLIGDFESFCFGCGWVLLIFVKPLFICDTCDVVVEGK
jgi:hypothetical protein